MLTVVLIVVVIVLLLAVLRRQERPTGPVLPVRTPGCYVPHDAEAVRPTLQDHPYVVEQRARMAAARRLNRPTNG